MVKPASGRRNSSSATEGLATHNLVCKMPTSGEAVQAVQSVQIVQNVLNGAKRLNGLNDWNGAARGTRRRHEERP
jgi:hypothetical protein